MSDKEVEPIRSENTIPASGQGSAFCGSAQTEFKQSSGRRILWSGGIALLIVILIVMFGPSGETVRKKFEYIGAEGPLVILQDLSVEEGHDSQDQVEKHLKENPPPPSYEVEDVPPDDSGDPTLKRVTGDAPPVETLEYSDSISDPDLDEMDLVEMNMEQMTNPNYAIIHFVKPQYPSLASEDDRRKPRVTVTLAIFVDQNGDVTAVYVDNSTASPVFEEVCLKAARQWKFKLNIEGPGMWIRCTIGFKGPYS